MLVDSHCHLDFFKNPKAIISNALQNDVKSIVSCATNPDSVKKNLEIKKEFKEVFICLGIHPTDLIKMRKEEINQGLNLVEKNLSECVGIGEIGLDFKHAINPVERKLQETLFRTQIRLALENDLALVVHSRNAELQAMRILKEEKAKKVLMHWFTNSIESVKLAEKNSFFMSSGPIIINSKNAAEIAKKIPEKYLVLETDAPVAFFGKQSEPSWIKMVLEKISKLKGVEKEKLAKKTTKNAEKLFSLNH